MRAAVACVALAAGCQVTGTYHCMTDDQCARGSSAGFCETSGYCSFTDSTCDTQRRYDSSAGSGLDSTCVETIVTGYYRGRFVVNDAAFMPSVVELPPAPTAVVNVTLDDGTQPKLHLAADGHFVFDIAHAGQAYRVFADGTEYQLAAPHLDIGVIVAGRADRVPVTMPTQLLITLTGNISGNDGIASTGLWTVFDTGTNNSSFGLDWRMVSSVSGALGLLDASKHDRLYVTKRVTTNGVTSLVGYGTADVTLADGMNMAIMNVAIAHTTDDCRQLTAPLADHAARLAMTVPGATPEWSWAILAAAAPDQMGLNAVQTLASTASPTAPANIDAPQMLGNPFPGTTLVADTVVALSYPFAMTGISGPNLFATSASASTFAAGATCAEQKSSLDATVAIAGEVSVGGTAITADDQAVTVDPTKTTQVTWKLAVPGTAGAFRITMFEVTNDGTNASLNATHTFFTVAPQLALAPGLLASGHTYIFEIVTSLSPLAAGGDFMTHVLPLASTSTYSHSFAVQ